MNSTDTEIINAIEEWIKKQGGSQVAVSSDVWAREGKSFCVCGHRGASIREAAEKLIKGGEGA